MAESLCEAMQSQSPVTLYSSALRVAALELTRICNDLRLLASGPMTGLAEILLPAVQPGSSIMPGKVNPSIIEMANQTWYSVLGYDQTIAYCAQAGQLELNVMMPMMAYSGLEATRVMTHTLSVLRTRCVEGLEPNREKLQKFYESTPQIATALSPKLGYEKTAQLVKESLKKNMSVIDLVRELKLIPESELMALIDVKAVTGE
jgi:aspartate ammonia-lyase